MKTAAELFGAPEIPEQFRRRNGPSTKGMEKMNETEKGTVIMNVFDEKTGEQIWQGIITSAITKDPAKREGSIPKKVNALMSKFPVKATKK